MIYLDNGATSFHKPPSVARAIKNALDTCANPGRGAHAPAMAATRRVYACRQRAAEMFDCQPEQVVFTANCTHGLNIAIQSLVKPSARVVISGFEHNAVLRPLYAIGAKITVAGRRLFDPQDTLESFENALKAGQDVAVFTHVSNVFGYILPAVEMAKLCREYGVPFVIDAAQSAGVLPVKLGELGANYIAMPGHKGLLGPQGTGILICNDLPKPLLFGGTGSDSQNRNMPDFLPDILEAGTQNVPGIAGLEAGLAYLQHMDLQTILQREKSCAQYCAHGLQRLGMDVFWSQDHQTGTLSFVPDADCEVFAQQLSKYGIAVRAGLHCAPLAHESAGTLERGTVRVSFGHDASLMQAKTFLQATENVLHSRKNF